MLTTYVVSKEINLGCQEWKGIDGFFCLDPRKKALLDVFDPSLDWHVSVSI